MFCFADVAENLKKILLSCSLTLLALFIVSKKVSLDIYIRRQNHEDVSMAPGGREQVRLQCPLEGAFRQVR